VAHAAPAQHATAHGDAHGAPHAVEHAHPTSNTYIVIALILTVITAIEVAVYYIPPLLPYIFPILIVLSAIKFVMVVGWFMHLKFDHTSFTWYFGGGLALALTIFGGLILLQIATHGLPPGDGHYQTHPTEFPGVPAKPAPSTGGGH
jgi:cytochrome c oxidase subunit 4